MTTENEIGQPFQGVARVHVRAYGSTGKWRFIGNVGELTPSHEVDVQKVQDYTRPGGGTATRFSRVKAVNLALKMLTFSPENIELAIAGDQALVAAATITAEVIKGYKGTTVPLLHPPESITAVTNSGATTTYDPVDPDTGLGDYEISAGGLRFPEGSAIVEAADLKVTYDHDDYVNFEAATKTERELEMFAEGQNEAQGNAPWTGNFWRVSVPAADQLALIGDKLAELPFKCECLKDATKGVGLSAFYRQRTVTPAA